MKHATAVIPESWWWLCMFLVLPLLMEAQQDSIFSLEGVEVTAQRIDLTDVGKHTDKIDSNVMAAKYYDNLASLLAQNTALYIRAYGAGTLATLGIRGGSSSHTQLLWNGVPLRNPMIGLVDLAMMPAAFLDEAAVHYGGHGAAFGSGAVGGLISFSTNDLKNNDLIKAGAGIGSWGRREGQLQLDYGFEKIRFSTRVYSHAAENNYQYRLNKDAAPRNQVHNHITNSGILQEAGWWINKDQQITGRLWYQSADRQVPPTSTQTTSKAAQQDKNLRASLQWNLQKEKTKWQIKTAWLDETIDYQDTLILLFTSNRFKTFISEGSVAVRLSDKLHLTGGLYHEIARAESDNYEIVPARNQSAAFVSAGYTLGDLYWRLQVREERTDDIWSPMLFDIASEFSFLRNFTLKASVSRNYRTPTLNDLHWRPGGNPDLVPEDGVTLESGIYYRNRDTHWKLNASVTAYTRDIDQWIMWMPPIAGERNFWSPVNIVSVNSRGLENRFNVTLQKARWTHALQTGADLTWSTFEEPLREFKIDAGEQLFYVPVRNAFVRVSTGLGKFRAYYQQHWFGKANGINDNLAAYTIGAGGLSIGFQQLRLSGTLYFQLDNMWDTPYRVIERRPMPGRTFHTGVKFVFD